MKVKKEKLNEILQAAHKFWEAVSAEDTGTDAQGQFFTALELSEKLQAETGINYVDFCRLADEVIACGKSDDVYFQILELLGIEVE